MRPSPSSPLSRTPPSTHPSSRRERGEAGVRGQGRQTGRDVPPHGGRRPRMSARRGVRTSRSLGDGAVPSTGPLRSPLRSTPMRAGCGCWNVRRRATALPTLSRPTHRREQDRRRRPNPPRRRRRSRPKPRGDGRADPSREETEGVDLGQGAGLRAASSPARPCLRIRGPHQGHPAASRAARSLSGQLVAATRAGVGSHVSRGTRPARTSRGLASRPRCPPAPFSIPRSLEHVRSPGDDRLGPPHHACGQLRAGAGSATPARLVSSHRRRIRSCT